MKLPKRIPLFHDPSAQYVEAHVQALSKEMINKEVEQAWWSDPEVDGAAAASEIDRHWKWTELEIERNGKSLPGMSIGVVTGDGAVQGALLLSTESVECEGEAGKFALFVELLFAAPRNRKWV